MCSFTHESLLLHFHFVLSLHFTWYMCGTSIGLYRVLSSGVARVGGGLSFCMGVVYPWVQLLLRRVCVWAVDIRVRFAYPCPGLFHGKANDGP